MELIPEYHGTNLPVTIHKQLGVRPVLVNGGAYFFISFRRKVSANVASDLWSANVLVDKDTENIRGLIDWQVREMRDEHTQILETFQLVHHGIGVEDLIRIAFSGMTSTDRFAISYRYNI